MHTKGPWTLDGTTTAHGTMFRIASEGDGIVGGAFSRDNAALLAAAPAMYEALKALAAIPVERFRGGNGPGNKPGDTIAVWHMTPGADPVELRVEHVLAARAAIARAEGQS